MSQPKLLSILGYLVLVAAVFYLLLTHNLLARSPAGVLLQICAVGLMIWARLTFGLRSFHLSANPTEGELITHGPYRFMRHPIYSAIFLFVATGVVSHWSLGTGIAGLVALVGILLRIWSEEKLLRVKYPAYADYAARTRRLIPFLY